MTPWLETLQAFRGLHFGEPPEPDLFRFMTQEEADMVTNNYTSEIGLKEFFPIGWFGTGDFVCAHPSGTLFVVLSDTFEWWDSDVTLEELLRRSEAADEALEEDVYSRNQPGPSDPT